MSTCHVDDKPAGVRHVSTIYDALHREFYGSGSLYSIHQSAFLDREHVMYIPGVVNAMPGVRRAASPSAEANPA